VSRFLLPYNCCVVFIIRIKEAVHKATQPCLNIDLSMRHTLVAVWLLLSLYTRRSRWMRISHEFNADCWRCSDQRGGSEVSDGGCWRSRDSSRLQRILILLQSLPRAGNYSNCTPPHRPHAVHRCGLPWQTSVRCVVWSVSVLDTTVKPCKNGRTDPSWCRSRGTVAWAEGTGCQAEIYAQEPSDKHD